MSHMDAAALAAWFRTLYGGPPRGIIFDCDGVVIDSREANIAYYNFLRPHKFNDFKPPVVDDILSKAENMPAKWQLMIYLGQQKIMELQAAS